MLRLSQAEELLPSGARRAMPVESLWPLMHPQSSEGGEQLPPVVFVINLDSRQDRLNETLRHWDHSTARLVRVAARQTIGNLNGCTLTHLSLILAIEEHGWPYVIVMEDDTDLLQSQWDRLIPGVLAHVQLAHGDVGWVNFHPASLEGEFRWVVDGLLISVGKMQTTALGLYGRRMIPAAHVLLGVLVDQPVARLGNAAVDFAFGRTRFGLPRSDDLLVTAEPIARHRKGFSDIEAKKTDYSLKYNKSATLLKKFREQNPKSAASLV